MSLLEEIRMLDEQNKRMLELIRTILERDALQPWAWDGKIMLGQRLEQCYEDLTAQKHIEEENDEDG
jgi:hypothetical protein